MARYGLFNLALRLRKPRVFYRSRHFRAVDHHVFRAELAHYHKAIRLNLCAAVPLSSYLLFARASWFGFRTRYNTIGKVGILKLIKEKQ